MADEIGKDKKPSVPPSGKNPAGAGGKDLPAFLAAMPLPSMNVPKAPQSPPLVPPGSPGARPGLGKLPMPPNLPPLLSVKGPLSMPPAMGGAVPKDYPGPAFPSSLRSGPAAPPWALNVPPAAPQASSPEIPRELERKVSELEKKLQEEREKVLLANLRSQEEANYASKVEMAIKEVQDKLRRDRREAEMEDSRLKLEAKNQELEQRLIQERETWVTTLKGQVQTREVQDKEIENHFAVRMQEMERRWMEEKAHWQKTLVAKEEEIRNLRALTEKLKGAEVELHKTSQEKKLMEERVAEMTQNSAELRAKAKAFEERERDYFQAKAELMTVKEQLRMSQERMEHEIQMLRMSAKEREDRLMSDNERLQRDIEAVAERVRRDVELDVKRYQAEANAHKAEAETATAALNRLKAVSGTLERQLATLKVQLAEAFKSKMELDKTNERYKAEFLVIQRRGQDREKEIRRETEEIARQKIEANSREWQKTVEAEKAKARLEAIESAMQARRPIPPQELSQ